MDVKLSRPVAWGGKTYEALALDFGGLTCGDIIACVETADALTNLVINDPASDLHVQTVVAAKAAGVIPPMLRQALSARDLLRVTRAAGEWLGSGKPIAMALDELPGAALLECADEAARQAPRGIAVLRLSVHYHVALAARASGRGVDEVKALAGHDGIATLREVRRFLLED